MMRLLRNLLTGTLAALALAACATDQPTDIGGSLLSSGDLVTFEVQLPAASFLLYDTAFSGYSNAAAFSYSYIAQQFEGTLDVHEIARFSIPPAIVAVRNTTTNALVNDSFPRYYAGRLVLKLDTTLASQTKPVKLHLFHTAEAWDASATWTNRVDSGSVHLPWSTPGGTRGASIDTATWASGDSVVFNVDSASLALWRDTANAKRGAIIVSETNGSRLRVLGTAVHVSTHSSIRADTVLNIDLVPTFRTFLVNPTLPSPSSEVRAGGATAWRTILRLRPDLQGMTFPCPGGPAGCSITLDSAHVSKAELLLKPARPPAGFSPEDTVVIQATTLAPSPLVPLERSPLGPTLSFSKALDPSVFLTPSDTTRVRLDVTVFVRHLTNANAAVENRVPPYIALLQVPEASLLGIAQFDPNPTLRIVLTSSIERRP